MTNVVYAGCPLCWMSFMLDIFYAGCCLCWMSLMVGAFSVLLNVVITIVKASGK